MKKFEAVPTKTFDIAIKYLQGIDFKTIPILIQQPGIISNSDVALIDSRHKKFIADPNNNISNDYYRSMCFATAVYHCVFKAYEWVSFFDVAIEIIEAHKDVTKKSFECYLGTVYPKIMVDAWIKYCEELKLKTNYLESECREDLFFCAYHYVIDDKS